MTVLSLALMALTLQNADTVPPSGAVESPYRTYQNPAVPISPDVVNAIADWILKQRP